MKKIIQFLNTPFASYICILFAIVNRCILSGFVSFIGKDKRLQLSIAENLLDGKGLGITKYFLSDVYTPVFDKTQEFPPGYSLLTAPILQLTGGNEYLAVTLLDLAIAILFILVIRLLCRSAGLSVATTNLITLVTGCFQYVFFMQSTPTDALALSLLFAGLAQVLYIIKRRSGISSGQIFFTGLLFFLPFFFRYANLATGLLLPLIICFYGYVKKQKPLIKTGMLLFTVTAIFTFGLLLFLKLYSGKAMPVYYTAIGVYPSNLQHWYPFIPASFISLDFAAQRAEQFGGISYSSAIEIFEILNLVLAAGVMVWLVWSLTRKKFKWPDTSFGWFIFTGSVISGFILLTLAYMSFRYAPRAGPFSWTFVGEQRHFGFIYIFLQIIFINAISNPGFHKLPRSTKFLAIAVVLVLCIEVLHGVYYNAKIVFQRKEMLARQTYKSDYLYFADLCGELEKQSPGTEILVASVDRHYCHTANKMGHKGIFDAENLGKTFLSVRRKSILLIPVHFIDFWIIEEYIKTTKPKLIKEVSGTQFYLQEIKPENQ
jgi:hypothetical protein